MADPTAPPRFIKDASSPTVYDTAGGFLDPVSSMDELHQRGGSDVNLATVGDVNQYFPNLYKQQATARYQPQTDLAINGLDQSLLGVDQGVTDENRSFDTLGQQLADAAGNATRDIQANLGRYGMTATGDITNLNKVQTDLAKNQQNSAADHASNLAKLALQRAGLLTQEGQVKTAGAQNIQDLVNQLLSGSTAAQQNAFDQKQKLNAITNVDLGNRIAQVDSQGNIKGYLAKGLTPSAGASGSSLSTAAGKQSALSDAVNQAFASGQYTSTGEAGKKSREQLIGELSGYFAGSGITTQQIKDAVYGNNRNATEGAYNPTASSATQTASQQQINTNYDTALKAFSTVSDASGKINIAGDKVSPAYLGQQFGVLNAIVHGNNTDYTNLNQGQAAILTTLRALLNIGRITPQEMTAIQFPTTKDTSVQAQAKLQFIKGLLDRGAPAQGQSGVTAAGLAPVSGKTSSGNGFTITKVP